MFKKHKLPVHLFLIFEKLNLVYWTTKANKPNYAFIFWPNSAILPLARVLSSELILADSTLIEASAIDTSKFFTSISNLEFFTNKFTSFLYYIFHFYFISYRLIFCFSNKGVSTSFESSYPNANWLEREFSEMYGCTLYSKSDNRNLLLDYTFDEHPLLKNYPCVGFKEVFYNPLEECVSYYSNTNVEL